MLQLPALSLPIAHQQYSIHSRSFCSAVYLMQVSKADQLADDAAALTPLQGASAAKTKLAKPSCQDEQPAGTAWSWPDMQSCCCSNHPVTSWLHVTLEHDIQLYKGTKVQECPRN